MNLSKVDLNLFIVFDAIYTEANLTRAGQIVGITQPAVSNALARLRETFNDPLFVRTAQGMVPTPMAQNIIGPVRNALSLLRVSVQESRIFNPLQAVKTYRISMTDLTEAVILPPLFQRLRRLAPTAIIESFLSKRRETTKELAAGRLIQVLPQWRLPSGGIHAVFPAARFRPAKVRAFVELLAYREQQRQHAHGSDAESH